MMPYSEPEIAPVLALPTDLAYFASAPLRYLGAGGVRLWARVRSSSSLTSSSNVAAALSMRMVSPPRTNAIGPPRWRFGGGVADDNAGASRRRSGRR